MVICWSLIYGYVHGFDNENEYDGRQDLPQGLSHTSMVFWAPPQGFHTRDLSLGLPPPQIVQSG